MGRDVYRAGQGGLWWRLIGGIVCGIVGRILLFGVLDGRGRGELGMWIEIDWGEGEGVREGGGGMFGAGRGDTFGRLVGGDGVRGLVIGG